MSADAQSSITARAVQSVTIAAVSVQVGTRVPQEEQNVSNETV